MPAEGGARSLAARELLARSEAEGEEAQRQGSKAAHQPQAGTHGEGSPYGGPCFVPLAAAV